MPQALNLSVVYYFRLILSLSRSLGTRHIVFACILNQFTGHWLLSDALNFAISINLKFKDEIDFATFDNLMEKK
jgi:hypothetical protein